MNFSAADFTEAYYKLNNGLFFKNLYQHERGGVTAHVFDVTMNVESSACELNLHDLNYTYNKWKMLNNLYLDPQELGVMIARINHYSSQSKHSKYVPDIAMQFKSRRNVSGACLLNISMGYHSGSWWCNVTSRASELTCRWPMDLIFVHVMIKTICEALNIRWEGVKVKWHMISTYQSITSMPYFLCFAGREDWFEEVADNQNELTDWQRYTLKRYLKCYTGDAYSNYGVQKRPMEAYRMLKGLIPRKAEVWTKDLELGYIKCLDSTLEDDYDEHDLLILDLDKLQATASSEDLWGKGGYR